MIGKAVPQTPFFIIITMEKQGGIMSQILPFFSRTTPASCRKIQNSQKSCVFSTLFVSLIILCGCGGDNNSSSTVSPGAQKIPDSILRQGLIAAAKAGDMESVRAFIQQGADIHRKDEFQGKTPLHWAVQQNHLEVAEFLLAKGANINMKSSLGGTFALMLASFNGYTEMVKMLLSKGADPNLKETSYFQETSLHSAAKNGHAEAVRALLAGGADLNVQNNFKKTLCM